MITSEELENCDFFPKNFTFKCFFKFIFYFIFMFVGFLFLFSFYVEDDIKTFIINYNSISNDNIFNKRLFFYQPKDKNNKYFKSFSIDNYENSNFYKNFIKNSQICLIKNILKDSNFFIVINNIFTMTLNLLNNNNEKIFIEIRNKPNIEFFSKNFQSIYLNYQEFLIKNNSNYFINEININNTFNNNIINDNLLKLNNYIQNNLQKIINLKFLNLFYSEGNLYDLLISGHTSNTNDFYCLESGNIYFILIPPTNNLFIKVQKEHNNYSSINFFDSKFSDRNFKKTQRIIIRLNKNECLFIPSHWWRSYKSISYNNFKLFTFKFEDSNRYLNLIL